MPIMYYNFVQRNMRLLHWYIKDTENLKISYDTSSQAIIMRVRDDYLGFFLIFLWIRIRRVQSFQTFLIGETLF